MIASDRLLTWNGGPRNGQVYRDEECKVVAIGSSAAVAYTGLARIEGRPTHEWIAVTLAKANCNRIADSLVPLASQASKALLSIPSHLRGITFLIAGWETFLEKPRMRPHIAVVTNQYDIHGAWLDRPSDGFRIFTRSLLSPHRFVLMVAGEPLSEQRSVALRRNLRSYTKNSVAPETLLMSLVEEVQRTSTEKRRVGDRILTVSLPRQAARESRFGTRATLFASTTSSIAATFAYYDPGRRNSVQYAPTSVFSGWAVTDGTVENDESTQRVSVRILHKPSTPPGQTGPYLTMLMGASRGWLE